MHTHARLPMAGGAGLLGGLVWALRALARGVGLAPRAWRERRRRRVRWLEAREPAGEEAAVFREAIVARGLSTYGAVTRYAADRLIRQDQAAGGYLAGIGLFRAWYLLDACRTLERLHGVAVWIEDEDAPWR